MSGPTVGGRSVSKRVDESVAYPGWGGAYTNLHTSVLTELYISPKVNSTIC